MMLLVNISHLIVEWLVYFSLAVSPFIIVKGYDTRYPKEFFLLMMAGVISFYAIYKGLFKPLKNRALFLIILAMIFATSQAPKMGFGLGVPSNNMMVMFNSIDVDGLWNYRPIVTCLIYLLMVVAISSIRINNINTFFSIVAWTGTLSAIFVILQKFDLNQFFILKPIEIAGAQRAPEITAFLGQYTLVGAFMALCFLAALYLKKYWMIILIALAIYFTTSRLAIFAAIFGLLCLPFIIKGKRWMFHALYIFIFLAIISLFFSHFSDSGRFAIWTQILYDMTHPLSKTPFQFAWTGHGAGAFHYYFPILHGSPAYQAHNEYLEFFFNAGCVGIILLFSAIALFFKDALTIGTRESRVLISMLLVSCLLAFGTFFWQLSVGGFYTAVIIGLTYNLLNQKEQSTA